MPEQGIDAGQQIPDVKGLGQIIVCSGIQPLNAVFQFGTSGEHQDGSATAFCPNFPSHLIAIHFWHHHIQNQQVINPQFRVFRAVLAVIDALRLKALALQN